MVIEWFGIPVPWTTSLFIPNCNKKINVDWRFFPNEPEKCMLNVEHRADGRKVFEFIKQLSKVYEPETVFYKIWQNGIS